MRSRTVPGLLSLVVAVVAACGGSSASQSPSASAAPSPSPSIAPTAASATAGDELHVGIRDFVFALSLPSLHPGPPGVAVTVDNGGEVPHTITFYADAGYTQKVPEADSGTVGAGASTSFAFTPPDGVTALFYRCEVHPTQMLGQIPVSA